MRACACVCVWGITPAFVYVCPYLRVCVCACMCGGECARALYARALYAVAHSSSTSRSMVVSISRVFRIPSPNFGEGSHLFFSPGSVFQF